MTTIAFDGTTLAADTMANSGGMRRSVSKIFKLDDGRLFGAAGEYQNVLMALEWLNKGGERPALTDDFTGLLVDLQGQCFRYEHKLYPSLIAERFTACGSGRDFAIAAMHLGKSATEAVAIAGIFDVNTGRTVQNMTPTDGVKLEEGKVEANDAGSLRDALEMLMERIDEPPKPNCSCHLSPPCEDCAEHGGLREAFEAARDALK